MHRDSVATDPCQMQRCIRFLIALIKFRIKCVETSNGACERVSPLDIIYFNELLKYNSVLGKSIIHEYILRIFLNDKG